MFVNTIETLEIKSSLKRGERFRMNNNPKELKLCQK